MSRWGSSRSRRRSTTRTSRRWSSSSARASSTSSRSTASPRRCCSSRRWRTRSRRAGANAVTRADVLAAAKGITSFDAGGMIGPNNIAERKTGPCFLVLQVKNKKWTRAYPSKPGTFDCNRQERDRVRSATRPADRWNSTARSRSSPVRRPASAAPPRRAFASRGMKVVLAARRVDRLEAAVGELRADGFDAVGVRHRRRGVSSRSGTSPTCLRRVRSRRRGVLQRRQPQRRPCGRSRPRRVARRDRHQRARAAARAQGVPAAHGRRTAPSAVCSRRRRARGSTAPRTTLLRTRRPRRPSFRSWRASTARSRDQNLPLHVGVVVPPLTRTNLAGDDLSIWESRRQRAGDARDSCRADRARGAGSGHRRGSRATRRSGSKPISTRTRGTSEAGTVRHHRP